MSWRKYFNPVTTNTSRSNISPISGSSNKAGPARTNYSSYLPDVYTGSPNRIERYMQYETMDADSEINAALDILAEFCTQKNKENGTPFTLKFRGTPTNSEVKILKEYLQLWTKMQRLDTRMFRIARNLFKYGDGFFLRDPETQKWFYVDPGKVVKIIVNESEGKQPEQYIIRDINVNFQNLVVTQINPTTQNVQPGGAAYVQGGAGARGMTGAYPQQSGTRFSISQNEHAIDAKHVVHISLSEGLDNNYPFGPSLLESVFKVYKQKELLEDAIIIYRVQRAPERRVFYIDTGNLPSHLAMSFVERVKNEIHQRRIPSSTGGGSVIDSSYNPLCLELSTKIPLLDGRVLPLSELISEFESGKENWAYSCNPKTGEVVPGVINWAGVTRKNTQVIKLTFDNGKELVCTPDHKIPVFGKGFVEAKDLTLTDRLISFKTTTEKLSADSDEHQRVWDHASKSWKWTHRLVGEFFRKQNKHQEFTYLPENIDKDKSAIHHKDLNSYNNDPRNLTYMNQEDCMLYRAVQKKDFWETMLPEHKAMLSSRIFESLKENWGELSASRRATAVWNIHTRRKIIATLLEEPNLAIYQANAGCRVNFIAHICSKLNQLRRKFNYKNWSFSSKQVDNFDCRVTKIEKVENRDTGTITVDGTEKWHAHHTFAVDSGIFVKNSINEDYFFPQGVEGRGSKVDTLPGGCFSMDTRVSLLDGRELSIREIEQEMQQGKELWTYSCEPKTGAIVPGLITWAGVTQKSAKVMRITLDNGESFVCTPCHKFPQYNAEHKRAGELIIGDSLIPLYRRHQPVNSDNNNLHEQVFNNATKTWEFTHQIVEDYLKDAVVVYQVCDPDPNSREDNIALLSTADQLGHKSCNDSCVEQSYNHKIVNIEWLEDEIEVGTLTIDGDELYHDYHTFALSVGVMTFNSNLGEIDDLKYFTNKLMRALRIPSSYLPTGADDGQSQYNDGRVGTAYIQELRFNKYCERLQNAMQGTFDTEFKLFLQNQGINIDFSLFSLCFQSPQNFAAYRQAELDNQRISTFTQMAAMPFISKQFALKRFLGLTDEDIAENEQLWKRENNQANQSAVDSAGEMRSVGVTPTGIQSDLDQAQGAEEAPPDVNAEEVPAEEVPAAPAPEIG